MEKQLKSAAPKITRESRQLSLHTEPQVNPLRMLAEICLDIMDNICRDDRELAREDLVNQIKPKLEHLLRITGE